MQPGGLSPAVAGSVLTCDPSVTTGRRLEFVGAVGAGGAIGAAGLSSFADDWGCDACLSAAFSGM